MVTETGKKRAGRQGQIKEGNGERRGGRDWGGQRGIGENGDPSVGNVQTYGTAYELEGAD